MTTFYSIIAHCSLKSMLRTRKMWEVLSTCSASPSKYLCQSWVIAQTIELDEIYRLDSVSAIAQQVGWVSMINIQHFPPIIASQDTIERSGKRYSTKNNHFDRIGWDLSSGQLYSFGTTCLLNQHCKYSRFLLHHCFWACYWAISRDIFNRN